MSPTIRISNQVTAANALTGLKFAKLAGAALLSLAMAGVTVTDTVSFSIGDRDVMLLANPNIEISADVVDWGRDQVLFAEPAGGGEDLFMAVTVGTAVNFLLLIDEL